MINPTDLEAKFQEFMEDLSHWAPDSILSVDLEFLHSLGLLNEAGEAAAHPKHPLTHYFHVIETVEKITLFNDQFVVWIVPQAMNNEPATFTLVALLGANRPRLEIVFVTTGVYNSSRIVLRVLEQLLEDIQENEEILSRLE